MKKLPFSKYLFLIIFFGIVGTFVSAKLLTLEFHALKDASTAFTSCSLNSIFDCASVAKSNYSELFGFPNMILGLIYYPMAITFFGMLFFGVKPKRWMMYAMLIPVTLGFLFSLTLLYISLFILFKVCLYCLGSTISGTAIFIMYHLYLIQNKETTYSLKLTTLYHKVRSSKYLLPMLVAAAILFYGLAVAFAQYYYRTYFGGDITLRSILMFPITFFKLAWQLIAH
jgi:uncharacterized membrane protein